MIRVDNSENIWAASEKAEQAGDRILQFSDIKVEAWEEALHGIRNEMFISTFLRSYSNEGSAASSHQVKLSQWGSNTIQRKSFTGWAITASRVSGKFAAGPFACIRPWHHFPASANGWPCRGSSLWDSVILTTETPMLFKKLPHFEGCVYLGADSIWEISVSSAQFCWEPTTALKIKICHTFKKKSSISGTNHSLNGQKLWTKPFSERQIMNTEKANGNGKRNESLSNVVGPGRVEGGPRQR